MAPEPSKLHSVTEPAAPPKMMSETNIITMVRRLPTDVTMGPQMPSKI